MSNLKASGQDADLFMVSDNLANVWKGVLLVSAGHANSNTIGTQCFQCQLTGLERMGG